jgi:methionyl-tRNA synthetase
MKDTWYLTTPIYYVNDVPHIGHAYTTVVADVLARWQRLHGRKVHFLTGTDEHGAKQVTAAEAAGKTPKEWVDGIVPRWRELWERLQISNDDFIRTTEPRHEQQVVPFMEKLREADDVYLGTYEGWYCVRCEEFKTDTELVDGNCAIHGSPVDRVQEDNWFFKLSKYNDALLELYTDNPRFLRPERAYNEMFARLKDGLRDIPISRPSVEWGIPIPWDPGHVIYVWIEALQNYITAIEYGSAPERFAHIWPADLHLVGKEIVWHHAVVWPAMLMSAGLPLPERVFAHGWLLAGGEKISKSGRSITQISPHELADTYGVDAYRYHFLRSVPFGDDGNFSLEDMQARYTADLANDLGNLASRTIAMIDRYFDGRIPSADAAGEPEAELRTTIAGAGPDADALVAELRLTQAIDAVWRIVRHANRYLVEREPWKLAKDEVNRPTVAAVLHVAAEALAVVAALLSPVMPGAMSELWSRLGYEGEPRLDVPAPEGNTVRAGDPLFPRIEGSPGE